MKRIRQKARKKNINYEAKFRKSQENLKLFQELQKQEMALKQEERRLREKDMLENYKRKKKQDVILNIGFKMI